MGDVRSQFIMALFAWVPYMLVSFAYMKLTEGSWKDFWVALGALIVVRLFFGIIEMLGGSLAWRMYGKKLMVNKHLQLLHANKFPTRQYSHDDFSAYMSRIADDPDSPAPLIVLAKEATHSLELAENLGILIGMRVHSAAEAALDIYSPKSEAPVFGASGA
jgi:hypothetical protein